MMHENRRWCLAEIADPEALARTLTERTWPLCSGFYVKGHEALLFLNDSTSEDGAQEYAVLQWLMCKVTGDRACLQIESITFSWCMEEQALLLIRELLAGQDEPAMLVECDPKTETSEQHGRCSLCA